MTLKLLINTFLYMQSAPYFWVSWGFTIAIAMFIGAVVYNGNVDQAKKGMIAVASYTGMLLWITLTRVLGDFLGRGGAEGFMFPEKPFAGAVTIIMVSLAWAIGMILGVVAFKSRKD